LQQDIDRVRKHRRLYRTRRKKMAPPVVALVGYTNAGKSTLFNTLCGASVMAEDKLFSTLDPVTRRVLLPDARGFLLTDTVGFIHKLPHSIVAAFRATLEELEDADLLLNVVDIMHPHAANQCLTVENVLRELQLGGKPRITVFNKLDLARPCGSEAEALAAVEALRERIAVRDREVAMVSALKGWGIPGLLAKIDTYLSSAHRYGGGCDENNDSV